MEYIAYKGEYYTIEWYFDRKGQSIALDYYNSLDMDDRIKVIRLFKLIGNCGKIFNKTKFMNEGDKIYAFKPQPNRFLCFFFEGNKIIITNGFKKKQQKLPMKEKTKAIKIYHDYLIRIKKGVYYE